MKQKPVSVKDEPSDQATGVKPRRKRQRKPTKTDDKERSRSVEEARPASQNNRQRRNRSRRDSETVEQSKREAPPPQTKGENRKRSPYKGGREHREKRDEGQNSPKDYDYMGREVAQNRRR